MCASKKKGGKNKFLKQNTSDQGRLKAATNISNERAMKKDWPFFRSISGGKKKNPPTRKEGIS